eukprot:COSAG02_NODE_46922_length_345_cov_0.626016_1_plen_53_part_01
MQLIGISTTRSIRTKLMKLEKRLQLPAARKLCLQLHQTPHQPKNPRSMLRRLL